MTAFNPEGQRIYKTPCYFYQRLFPYSRTINYYNLQDGMILETTSNPFWVTTLYSNLKRREQEAAANPGDARLCAQAQTSIIHRYMAIGLLLNGTGYCNTSNSLMHSLAY